MRRLQVGNGRMRINTIDVEYELAVYLFVFAVKRLWRAV
jgi:hypothetical protein